MKIGHVSQLFGAELQKAAGNTKAVSKPDKVAKEDSVSVSKEGKNLSTSNSSIEAASNRIEGLPEVRWDKVASAKERVESGFYNTQEFRNELADRLIKDFGLGNS